MRNVFREIPVHDQVAALPVPVLAERLLLSFREDDENRTNFTNEVYEAYAHDEVVARRYLAAWAYLASEGLIIEKSEPGWFFLSEDGIERRRQLSASNSTVPQVRPFGARWQSEGAPLGSGGQGVTYLARERGHNGAERYVVKVLRDAANEQARQRFATEAKTLADLDHPNILRVLAMDLDAKEPWYISEYLSGRGLDKINLRATSLDFRMRVFLDVCRGLAAAHERGITHRDIKPENILLRTADGPAVLADFGICWLAEDETRLTRAHEDIGSSFCRAPELFDGPVEQVHPTADIYCLGKLLYWLMVGEGGRAGRLRAEEFDSDKKNLIAIHADDRYEHINQLLRRMIVEEPRGRFQNAGEVVKAAANAFALIRGGYAPVNRPPSLCNYCGSGEYRERMRDFGTSSLLALLQDFRMFICTNCGHTVTFARNPVNSGWK